MTDKISPEQRRKNMQAIKSKSKLEDLVAKEIWHRNVRYRRNVKTLFGTPDIAIKKYKIVIFIDSCFWHYCPIHCKIPKSNNVFWENKLIKNKERDAKVTSFYLDTGWHILRIWEHEINSNLESTVDKIMDFINMYRR